MYLNQLRFPLPKQDPQKASANLPSLFSFFANQPTTTTWFTSSCCCTGLLAFCCFFFKSLHQPRVLEVPRKAELSCCRDDDDGKRTNTHAHALSKRPAAYAQSRTARKTRKPQQINRPEEAVAGLETRRSNSKCFRDELREFVRLFNTSGASARTHTHTQLAAIVTRDESRGSTVESDFGETTPRESEHYFDYTAFFLLFLGATLDSPFFFPFVSFLIFCTRLLLNLLLLFLNSPGSSRTAMG